MHRYSTPDVYGLNVFPFGKQILPDISGQGHPMNIDYLHVVELVSPMLQGKFHYHYMYLAILLAYLLILTAQLSLNSKKSTV